MTPQEIYHLLCKQLGEDAFEGFEEEIPQAVIHIKPTSLLACCQILRNDERLYFDYLQSISGVDYGIKENTIGTVYHLSSIVHEHAIVLKCTVSRDTGNEDVLPRIPSVMSLWRAADWHEREAYDLVGIFFEGHEDMRRILLPADWEGHPLRKNYQTPDTYHGIKVESEESDRSNH